ALHERHRQRRARRLRPFHARQRCARDNERERAGRCGAQRATRVLCDRIDRLREERRDERDRQRDEVNAAERRVTAHEPVGHLRITDRQPRETGEQITSHPFRGRERAHGGENARPRCGPREARGEIAGERRPQRKIDDENRDRDQREPRRHAAERDECNREPRRAGAEKSQAEREAEPRAVAGRFGVLPLPEEQRQRDERNARHAERRERQRQRAGEGPGAKDERRGSVGAYRGVDACDNPPQDQPSPSSPGGGAIRSTCSVWNRRLSARSTRKRNPPSAVISPRFGRRPNACRTSPPTVSNSSSSNDVPNCALKSPISVCALTRKRPFASGMMLSSLSSKSYSSSMSPTICSSTSSI